jgi:hypothetical protein
MNDVYLTERVTNLEELMAEFLRAQARTQVQIELNAREARQFKREMLLFKQEMTAFKDEMAEFKDEMAVFKDEMAEFKDEMRVFKEETRANNERNDRERREFRQQLADISHKMGTLAEDMVAPSVPRILQEIVQCPEAPAMLGVRIRKRLPGGRSQEYDVVAVCGEYLLINETKSRLRPEDIPAFLELLREARTFLPEYADKRVIGALATFYVDPSLILHDERQGLIMLGVVDGLMQVLNTPEFSLQSY